MKERNNITISERAYARNLKRQHQPTNGARYIFANSWRTDGVRVYRHVFDLSRKARPPDAGPEHVAISKLENRVAELSQQVGLNQAPSPFGGVVGIDPGQSWTAAAFFLPSDPAQPGSQVALRKRFLYGDAQRNQRWLENRKAKEGINAIEDELSKFKHKAVNLVEYISWVRVQQSDGRMQKLRTFYNSRPVRHRAWDTRRSMRSRLDQACEIIERLAGPVVQAEQNESELTHRRKYERQRPTKPILFVIGDGEFSTVCSGSRPSLHNKFLRHFVKRARAHPRSLCVSVDEYMTSKKCPNCLGDLAFWRRPPRSRKELERKGADDNGLVSEYRVQYCAACKKFLHRDCSAAQCFTAITDSLLKSGRKPHCFVRPG